MPATLVAQRRITAALFASQSLIGAVQIAAFTVMPIVASTLTGSDAAVGIPATLLLVGRAGAAYPMGWIMDRYGRRLGLLLGFVLAVLGAAAALIAIAARSFLGFGAGIFLMGVGRAAGEQMRYTAAEVYPPAQRGQAIGRIVLAGTVGAIIGPLLVDPSGRWAERLGQIAPAWAVPPGGSIRARWPGASCWPFCVPIPPPSPTIFILNPRSRQRLRADPCGSLFAGAEIRLAVAALAISQLVMTLLMVITPLHMTRHHHGLQTISWVMMAHTLGMFAFSGLTGRLIARFGERAVIVVGVCASSSSPPCSRPSRPLWGLWPRPSFCWAWAGISATLPARPC